jgi:hypothetical protein
VVTTSICKIKRAQRLPKGFMVHGSDRRIKYDTGTGSNIKDEAQKNRTVTRGSSGPFWRRIKTLNTKVFEELSFIEQSSIGQNTR